MLHSPVCGVDLLHLDAEIARDPLVPYCPSDSLHFTLISLSPFSLSIRPLLLCLTPQRHFVDIIIDPHVPEANRSIELCSPLSGYLEPTFWDARYGNVAVLSAANDTLRLLFAHVAGDATCDCSHAWAGAATLESPDPERWMFEERLPGAGCPEAVECDLQGPPRAFFRAGRKLGRAGRTGVRGDLLVEPGGTSPRPTSHALVRIGAAVRTASGFAMIPWRLLCDKALPADSELCAMINHIS